MRILPLLCCLLLAGCHPSPRARYPEPVTRYQGRTATEWVKDARDTDGKRSWDGLFALAQLGAEGIPFLLDVLESRSNESDVAECLNMIRGNLIDQQDVHRLAPFLGEAHAKSDGPNFGVRYLTLVKLKEAGHKAILLLPQIKTLAKHPVLGPAAKETEEAVKQLKSAS